MHSVHKQLKKIVKRHQILSTKQGCLSIDKYVSSSHQIFQDCSLGDMYDEIMLQTLLLGVNDERLRQSLFEESEALDLELTVKKFRIVKTSNVDMKAIKSETDDTILAVKVNSRKEKKVTKVN